MEKKDFIKYWSNFFNELNYKKQPHLGYLSDFGSFYVVTHICSRWENIYNIDLHFLIKALHTEEEIETGKPKFGCAAEGFVGGLKRIELEKFAFNELENIGKKLKVKLAHIEAKGLDYFKELIIPKANQHVHPIAVEYLKTINIL